MPNIKSSHKSSRRRKPPSWALNNKTGRHGWNAKCRVDPAGYEWAWDLQVNYGRRQPFKPELKCITCYPTWQGDDPRRRPVGPWLIPGTRTKLHQEAPDTFYDPLSWSYLKEPDLTEDRAQPRLHRRFAELPYDPDAIRVFANRWGLLGENGLDTTALTIVRGEPRQPGRRDFQGYAENFDTWCQEIMLMKRLCLWWDLSRDASDEGLAKLQEWFDPSAGRLSWVRRDALTDTIPDLDAMRRNAIFADAPEHLCESKEISANAPHLLQAAMHLTVKVPVSEETRKKYDQMGWDCPEYWIEEEPNPDIFAIAGLTINEIVNEKLAETCRVAVQFNKKGEPDNRFYTVAETLLACIYRSFIGEVLGDIPKERYCLWCRQPFEPKRNNQVYCCSIHKSNDFNKTKRALNRPLKPAKK